VGEARLVDPWPASKWAARPAVLSGLPSAHAPGAGQEKRLPPHWIAVIDGQQLRQARRQAKLSQARLAYAAGVSVTTVAKLESQPRVRCHVRTLTVLAKALGRNRADFVISPPPGTTTQSPAGQEPAKARASWPGWTCGRTFPGRADQAGEARAFLRRVLAGCPLSDDLVLICSELAANAVTHSRSAQPGGWFTVRVEVREGDYAFVEVEDQGGRWQDGDQAARQGGRGLAVVGMLADYWDIRGEDTGRVVCARIDWRDGTPDDAA
jgi:serine/threonine-protein kinase RsbW